MTGTEVETVPVAEVLALLRDVRAEVARLGERVATLEETLAGRPPAPAAPAARPDEPEALDTETLAVIAAAVAAYLGVTPRIRQIRLVASPQWTHQARASIHGSHALPGHRTGGTA